MGTGANTLHDSLMHMSMYFSLLRCFLLKQQQVCAIESNQSNIHIARASRELVCRKLRE